MTINAAEELAKHAGVGVDDIADGIRRLAWDMANEATFSPLDPSEVPKYIVIDVESFTASMLGGLAVKPSMKLTMLTGPVCPSCGHQFPLA